MNEGVRKGPVFRQRAVSTADRRSDRPGARGELCPWSKITAEQARAAYVSTDPIKVTAQRLGMTRSMVTNVRKRLAWRTATEGLSRGKIVKAPCEPKPKKQSLAQEELEAYLRGHAGTMTPTQLGNAAGHSASYIRRVCVQLGIDWKGYVAGTKPDPNAADDFVPRCAPTDALPALAGSAQRVAELAKRAAEGRELFGYRDRHQGDAVMIARGRGGEE